MEYTEFGKTQLRVSRMCLGTWGIGGAGWDSYSDESRMDAIKAAVDCGINFIDTAPAYGTCLQRRQGRTVYRRSCAQTWCQERSNSGYQVWK